MADSDVNGTIGCSLRVWVSMDVSKPLSRGRKLWDNGVVVGWVTFRYERLPNFCYWCGSLLHKDRECDLWLGMKDKDPLDKKQFGPWMRAELEYSSRRPWSSGVGSERVEFSHAHKSRLTLVKEVPISCVSCLDAGVPRAETT